MKNDGGFIQFNAVFLLFFIAAVITGCVLYTSSAMNYSVKDKQDFNNKRKADLLLDEIVEKMQELKLYSFDDKNNEVLYSLCLEYEEYKLKISDVSSGFNLNFISDLDLSDTSITRLIFLDNTGNAFRIWRNANGLTFLKDDWKELIKEEALEYCSSFGWLHINDLESYAFRSISSSFSTTDTDKLFPLINNFPRINVNNVNPDILRPLVMRSSFNIERPREKADILINRLRENSLTHQEIASIMRVTVNHPLMGYLGTKTAFWKINFSMINFLEVEAIIAAIPEKDGLVQEIESYRLIKRSFIQ